VADRACAAFSCGLIMSSMRCMSQHAAQTCVKLLLRGLRDSLCACAADKMGLFNWFFTWVRAMPSSTSDCYAWRNATHLR
jgi:hypothetical protein